jgi:apolipoprotein N-acyltransferase
LAPLNECVAFGLNWFKCSWVLACARRCYWVLLVCSWVLLGSSWVFVGFLVVLVLLGCPWVLLVILTSCAALRLEKRYNIPPKQSMLSTLNESDRILVLD